MLNQAESPKTYREVAAESFDDVGMVTTGPVTICPTFAAIKGLLSGKPLRRPSRHRLQQTAGHPDDRGEEVPLPESVVQNLLSKNSKDEWNRRDDVDCVGDGDVK